MNIALWVAQILLALAFAMFGFSKVAQPLDTLAATLPWVLEVPTMLVRFIGVAEIAGALGLVLPRLTKIQPRLTAWAAVGLTAIMVLAAIFHATRGEFGNIAFNAILAAIAIFVAWGRWSK